MESQTTELEPCELLEWDSRFFSIPVARVAGDQMTARRAAEVEDWCRPRRVRWLYFLGRSDDPRTIQSCQENGYQLVEVRVELRRYLTSGGDGAVGAANSDSIAIRPARSADVPALECIARKSHRDSRYYADSNIPRDRCDAFYAAWIRNSAAGWAQSVLVCEQQNAPAGYVTCHLRQGRGEIGLIAVDEAYRGKGIGFELIAKAIQWFRNQGVPEIAVVTQGSNVTAQRLYQRCGFLTHRVGLYYHRWRRQGADEMGS